MNFTKGIEYWYAQFYDLNHTCFIKDDLFDEFGEFIAAGFNENEVKEDICGRTWEEAAQFKNIFPNISDSQCFKTDPIKFIKDRKYIRFPDFKSDKLKEFIIRIDINPCIEQNNSMTKIYCIPRYHKSVDEKQAFEFFRKARAVCNAIIPTVYKKYFSLLNEFIGIHNIKGMQKIDLEKLPSPYTLVSHAFGDDNDYTRKFILLSESPKELDKFIEKDGHANAIAKTLEKMCHLEDSSRNIPDYTWTKHTIMWRNKKNGSVIADSANNINESHGYIGFRGNGNLGHIIGITDSTPRDILLPLHIEIINAN